MRWGKRRFSKCKSVSPSQQVTGSVCFSDLLSAKLTIMNVRKTEPEKVDSEDTHKMEKSQKKDNTKEEEVSEEDNDHRVSVEVEEKELERRTQRKVNNTKMLGLKQAHLADRVGSSNKRKPSKSRTVSATKASANKQIYIRKFYSFKTRDSQDRNISQRGKVKQGVINNLQTNLGNPVSTPR